MFNRAEASRIRQDFWTTFGKYMGPIPSSEGMRINWVNYHTKVKDVYFRMEAEAKSASIFISMEHRDHEIQELYFQQFVELKMMLQDELQENWEWNLRVPDREGRIVSRIHKELSGVSVFNKDHWPELISFFKPRIISLDRFWENAKYAFESLR